MTVISTYRLLKKLAVSTLNYISKSGKLSVLFFLLFVSILNQTFAENGSLSNSKNTSQLEAVILIDSSGSMLSTDPTRLRDEGAKLFVQSLKAGDKLAVIEFSDLAKVIHKFSEYNPEQDQEISDEISKIENDGIYTDLLSGIILAQDIFNKNKSSNSDKVIILLSDGKMDPDPAKASPKNQTNELFNNYLPELKSAGVKLHTLALSDKSDKDLLAEISASTGGMSVYAADATLIHQAFANLFLAVKKPQVLPLTGKGFKIDADIKEATFYINKEKDSKIVIRSPDGEKYSKDNQSGTSKVKWFGSQQFDVVTIVSPKPGNWTIEGMQNQDGFATLLTNLQLVTEWPSSISAEEESLFQARLYEEDKPVVLHGMSGALEYSFQVVPTDIIAEPIIKDFLNDDGKDGDKIANDGIFSKLIKIDQAGQYKMKVVVHSPTFDRYQHLPFQVKERMISLAVEKRKTDLEMHSSDSDHASKHKTESHEKDVQVKDSHAKDSDHKDEHDSDQAKEAEHSSVQNLEHEEDYFVATLSSEALDLKKVEVNLTAIDKDRNRLNLEMLPTNREDTYEIATNLLPEKGLYIVEASLAGVAKNRKTQKAYSQKISYLLEKAAGTVKVIKIDEADHSKLPEKTTGSGLYLGLISLWNLAASGAAFVVFKKAGSGPKIVIPEFENVETTKTSLEKLKEKADISEVNLSDPLFTGDGPIANTQSVSGESNSSTTEAKGGSQDAPAESATEGTKQENSEEQSSENSGQVATENQAEDSADLQESQAEEGTEEDKS